MAKFFKSLVDKVAGKNPASPIIKSKKKSKRDILKEIEKINAAKKELLNPKSDFLGILKAFIIPLIAIAVALPIAGSITSSSLNMTINNQQTISFLNMFPVIIFIGVIGAVILAVLGGYKS